MNGTLTLREGFVASRELQNGISNQNLITCRYLGDRYTLIGFGFLDKMVKS